MKNNLYKLFNKGLVLLLAIALLISSDLIGQNVITPASPTPAAWNNAANWDGSGIANTISEDADFSGANVGEVEVPNGYSVTVGNVDLIIGNTFTVANGGTMDIGATGAGNERNLISGNNSTINVNGNLVIWGDLIVDNLLTLNVTGTLTIKGDLTLKNNAGINISGDVVVDGDVDGGNNTNMDVDGSLDIGGDIDVGNGSSLTGDGTVSLDGTCGEGPGSTFCNTGPLPVELLEFRANTESSMIMLSWATASELNNDYFTLERSRNGREFELITTVQGNGTTSEEIIYEHIDKNPHLGLSYYRLSQTDYDGTMEIFPMISVLFDPGKSIFTISPNPLHGQTVNLKATGFGIEKLVELNIINLKGSNVNQQHIYTDELGNIDVEVQLENKLKKGIYIFELVSDSRESKKKVVVE